MKAITKIKEMSVKKVVSLMVVLFSLIQSGPVSAAVVLAPESLPGNLPAVSQEKASENMNSNPTSQTLAIPELAQLDNPLSSPAAEAVSSAIQVTPDGKHQVEYTNGVMIVRRAVGTTWQEVGRLGMCTSVTCVNGFSATNTRFYIEGRQRSSQFLQSYEYDNFPGPGSPVNLPAEVKFTSGSDFDFVPGLPGVGDVRGSDWMVRRVNIETGEILSSIAPSTLLGTMNISNISQAYDVASLGSASTTATSRGVSINFDTAGQGWSGGGFSFNRFSTAATEILNLSGASELVVGLRSTSQTVKIEIKDKNGKSLQLQLSGVSASEEKVWVITNMMLYSVIDPGSITEIFAIVEGASTRGTIEMNIRPAVVINPSSTLGATSITQLPTAWPINGTSTARGISISYNTAPDGYSFGGFSFDNPVTAAQETANLSGLSQLVLGFTGDAEKIKLEFTDSLNRKVVVYLNGIQKNAEKVWVIQSSDLAGIDLSKIKSIFAVIEAPIKTGVLQMNHVPAVYSLAPSLNLSTNQVTPWPVTRICTGTFCEDRPVAYGIAQGTTSAGTTDTARGVILTYNTGTSGWAGVSHSYNANATPQAEYADFSAISQLVIGLKGNASQVKMEFIDVNGKRGIVFLTGISATEEKVWAIQLSRLGSVDLKKIVNIDIVIEGQNQKGTLELTRVPSLPVLTPSSVNPANMTSLPATVNGPVIARVGPEGAYGAVGTTTRGETFSYDTKTAGWVGGGFTWDNFSTGSVETVSFSGVSQVLLGLKGDAAKVKVELIDASGKKASVYLSGISKDQEKVWVIPMSLMTGIDTSKIRLMYVIVEGNNQKGSMEINHKPLPAPVVPSGWARTASNSNFAYQFRVSGTYTIAIVRDLRTGREYEVAKILTSGAAIAAIDVAADGSTVMTAVKRTGASSAAFDISFQKLDKTKPAILFKADYRGYSLSGNNALIYTLQGNYAVDLLGWRIV